MKTYRILFFAFILGACGMCISGCSDDSQPSNPGGPPVPPKINLDSVRYAVIQTNYGDIEVEFYRDIAPKTVRNFVLLADSGYYNEVTFHRVIKNFMMQGGDPTGTGDGGRSIYGETFEDEIDLTQEIVKQGYRRGIMAMANAGPNTNGSQFFIMHKTTSMPRLYTIFGKVVEGIATVDSICTTATDSTDRPLERIFMKKIILKTEK